MDIETDYKMSDVPDGYAILSNEMDSILVPVDEYWLGFGISDCTMAIIDDEKLTVHGQLVRFHMDIRT